MLVKNIKILSNALLIFILFSITFYITGCSNYEQKADQLLLKLSNYEYENGLQSLAEFTDLVSDVSSSENNSKEVEKSILKFLDTDATLASKRFVSQQLSIIGSESSLPILSKLLENEMTADIALYPLQRIQGKSSEKILIDHLSSSVKAIQIGCINSLGICGSEKAIPKISELLNSKDHEIAIAAATALGNIGSDKCIEILKSNLDKTDGNLQNTVADAYLKCANNLINQKDSKAQDIYSEIYKANLSTQYKEAALIGLINTAEDKEAVILNSLKNDEENFKSTAIQQIHSLPENQSISNFSNLLLNLSPSNQIQMLGVIKKRKDKDSKKYVLKTLKSSEPLVRIASLQALSVIGDNSDVLTIASIAANKSGLERRYARESLDVINDTKADQIIIEKISSTDKPTKIELIRSAGARGLKSSFDVLLKCSESDDRQIRTASYSAIADIATNENLSTLFDKLYHLSYESDRKRMERTIIRIINNYPDEKTVNLLINNIDSDLSTKNVASTIKLLGATNSLTALNKLREYIESDELSIQLAAVEGLTFWNTSEPIYDLLAVTEKTQNEKIRAIALEGFTKFIQYDRSLSDSAKIELYKTSLKYSKTINEKNRVLEGIGQVDSFTSLEILKKYYNDQTVKETVEDGINRVAWHIRRRKPEEVKAFILDIIKITKDERYIRKSKELIIEIDRILKER